MLPCSEGRDGLGRVGKWGASEYRLPIRSEHMSFPDWKTPWKYSFPGFLRNISRELVLHFQRLMQPSNLRRIVIMPCGFPDTNPASFLRAYEIGKALKMHWKWRVTIISPRFSLSQRLRILRLEQPDLILMQMERHPLNRPVLYKPFRVIFDIDDADFLWEHARPLVEECCNDSTAVVAGSNFVADWVRGRNANVCKIWTGSPSLGRSTLPPQRAKKNIIAWGHSRPMDYPEEARFIEEVLLKVAQHTTIEYWVFGVKNTDAAIFKNQRFKETNIRVRTFEPMPYDKFTKKLQDVAIGIQVLAHNNPYSQGKSFGKILNYIEAGVCVVASSSGDHGDFFDSGVNGVLANSMREWVDGIINLCDNGEIRNSISTNASKDLMSQLSMKAISRQYDTFLRGLLR